MTQGTNITEAFEVAHVFNERSESLLAKYFVRDCPEIPTTSRYTFKKDGFYNKLKDRVKPILKKVFLSNKLAAGRNNDVF